MYLSWRGRGRSPVESESGSLTIYALAVLELVWLSTFRISGPNLGLSKGGQF